VDGALQFLGLRTPGANVGASTPSAQEPGRTSNPSGEFSSSTFISVWT